MLSINISELIWAIINFFLLYFLLKRFLYTPVIKFMDERQERIDAGEAERKAMDTALTERRSEAENLCEAAREDSRKLLAESEAAFAQAEKDELTKHEELMQEKRLAARQEAEAEAERQNQRIEAEKDALGGILANKILGGYGKQ